MLGPPARHRKPTRDSGLTQGENKEERYYLANQLLATVQMYGSENVVSLERLQQ